MNKKKYKRYPETKEIFPITPVGIEKIIENKAPAEVKPELEIILEEKRGFRVWQKGYKLKKNETITQHPDLHIGTIVVRR